MPDKFSLRRLASESSRVLVSVSNPYPSYYGSAFACSLLRYPLSLGLALRFAVPGDPEWIPGETAGLPRSILVAVWVRSRLFAGGTTSAPRDKITRGLDHVPFWPKRIS